MKSLLLILSLVGVPWVAAKEHFAKAEPYEIRTVAANVAGQVVLADEALEGKRLGKEPYLKIDDELDRVELQSTREKIALLDEMITLNRGMIDNYTEMVQKKSANFERVRELKMRSQVEKDRDFYDLLASKNQLATVRKELENMRLQVSDLKLRQRQLERSIADKRLAAPGYTLYALLVKESQVVAPGTPLAQVADVSRAKLTLFLSEAERQGISDKVIYLDGAKTDYCIDRLWNIADDTHLSSYRAEIIIDAPDAFSRLVQVEFRDE